MFDLQPGLRIGRWTLSQRLGSGGLAEVWATRPDAEGRVAALKLLREPERSEAHVSRFLREGRLLQRLSHGGLPRCYEVAEEPVPFLALELLRGETLAERLEREGPLPPERVEAIADSLLRVLDFLHQNGIVHRDIKPSNVFFEDDRRVLLLDLGLAADPSDALTTTLGDVMGTYAYMAPEQIAGAELDHRADLYSLGVTLYEALGGSRPYYAEGATGYLQAHREARCRPISELRPDAPARLLDAIARLMARDPLARPPSASMARALLTGEAGAERRLKDPPLVGRAAASGAIEAVLDGGGCLVLQGEIGSGTGRMASEALDAARLRGFETIAIRCRRRGPPLDPIDQLARDLGQISGPVRTDPEELARALEALTAENGLLLLIEDIEQSTPEVMGLFGRLIRAVPRLSAILTGIVVPGELAGHLVKLRPLTVDETRRLVGGMLGTPGPPAGLSEQLYRMASGLPAVVVLGVRELVARGALWNEGLADDGSPRWRLDRKSSLEPASGLMRLFGGVLAGLSAEARRMLEVLAVVAEPLPLELALELGRADLSGLAALQLGQAGLADVESHSDGDWIVLRRPAVGSLVLAEVPPERQTAVHARLAELLGQRPQGPWRDARLAWHAAHSAPPERASLALLELGEELIQKGRQAEALRVLDRASQVAGGEPALVARLAVARGEALDAVARREEAVAALSAGLHLSREMGDPALTSRALVAIAHAWHGLGDERQTARLAEEALEHLKARPEDPNLPRALFLVAECRRIAGRPEDAGPLYQRCIQVSMQRGDRRFAALANGGLGALCFDDGNLDQAQRHLEREASWLRIHGRATRLLPTLYRLAATWRCLGRPDRALECLDEADDVARFAQLPYERALARVGRAAVHLALGDLGGTAQLMRQARVSLEADATTFGRLAFREVQLQVRLRVGDRQAALASAQAGEADARRAGYEAQAAYFLGTVGVLTADGDALGRAMEVLGMVGERRLAARLLLLGSTTGGDTEVLQSAEEEARASNDVFLLLEVLHASGSHVALEEALEISRRILPFVPAALQPSFLSLPAVRWTGLPARLRQEEATTGPPRAL